MRTTLVACCALLIISLNSAAADQQQRPRQKVLALGVDYADQVNIGYRDGYLYNEPRIRELIQKAKQAGIDEIYWRVSAIGLVTYPSKVMTVMDGEHLTNPGSLPPVSFSGNAIRSPWPSMKLISSSCVSSSTSRSLTSRTPGTRMRSSGSIHSTGPAWLVSSRTTSKRSYPAPVSSGQFSETVSTGGYSKLLTEGEKNRTAPYIPGVPSYGYPEVRNYLLSQVKELTSYKPDGIYFDVSRSHSGIYPVLAYGWSPQWTSPYLKYGYNEPEVALYRKMYGKNPPLRGITSLQSLEETQDEVNWNAVRGHFLTEFIRLASQIVHAAGMKVAVEFYPSTYNNFQPGAQVTQQLGRMKIDWKKWVDEKLIDIIRLNVDHRKHGFDDWKDASAQTYRYAQDRSVKVYVDCSISGTFDMLKRPPAPLPITEARQPDVYYSIISETTRSILNSSADGVFYYEAGDNKDALYQAIRKGAGRTP